MNAAREVAASTAIPGGISTFEQLRQNATLLEPILEEPGGETLLQAYVLARPRMTRTFLCQCLAILSKSKTEKEPVKQTLTKIRQLGDDRNVRVARLYPDIPHRVRHGRRRYRITPTSSPRVRCENFPHLRRCRTPGHRRPHYRGPVG